MRHRIHHTTTLSAMLLVVFFLTGLATAQEGSTAEPPSDGGQAAPKEAADEPSGETTPQAKLDDLSTMIEAALDRNPDVLLAEAERREAQSALQAAEAALHKARLQAARSVMQARAAYLRQEKHNEFLRKKVKQARDTLAQTRRLEGVFPEKHINDIRMQLLEAEQELVAGEAALAEIAAQFPYLMGEAAAAPKQSAANRQGVGGLPAPNDEIHSITLPSRLQVALPGLSTQRNLGLDQLRAPTTLEFHKTPLKEAIGYLEELHDINIVIAENAFDAAARESNRTPLGEIKITVELSDVSLGAALQAIEDLAQVKFTSRDYGLLMTPAGEKAQPLGLSRPSTAAPQTLRFPEGVEFSPPYSMPLLKKLQEPATLVFQDASLQQVVDILERRHEIEIEVQEEKFAAAAQESHGTPLNEIRVTAELRDERLGELLSLIGEAADVRFRVYKDKVIVMPRSQAPTNRSPDAAPPENVTPNLRPGATNSR